MGTSYKAGSNLFLKWSISLFAYIFITRYFKKIRDQIKHNSSTLSSKTDRAYSKKRASVFIFMRSYDYHNENEKVSQYDTTFMY